MIGSVCRTLINEKHDAVATSSSCEWCLQSRSSVSTWPSWDERTIQLFQEREESPQICEVSDEGEQKKDAVADVTSASLQFPCRELGSFGVAVLVFSITDAALPRLFSFSDTPPLLFSDWERLCPRIALLSTGFASHILILFITPVHLLFSLR
jgi:hypothetical protein